MCWLKQSNTWIFLENILDWTQLRLGNLTILLLTLVEILKEETDHRYLLLLYIHLWEMIELWLFRAWKDSQSALTPLMCWLAVVCDWLYCFQIKFCHLIKEVFIVSFSILSFIIDLWIVLIVTSSPLDMCLSRRWKLYLSRRKCVTVCSPRLNVGLWAFLHFTVAKWLWQK